MPKSRERIIHRGFSNVQIYDIVNNVWSDLGYIEGVEFTKDTETVKVVDLQGKLIDEVVKSESIQVSSVLLQSSAEEMRLLTIPSYVYLRCYGNVSDKLWQAVVLPEAKVRPRLRRVWANDLAKLTLEISAIQLQNYSQEYYIIEKPVNLVPPHFHKVVAWFDSQVAPMMTSDEWSIWNLWFNVGGERFVLDVYAVKYTIGEFFIMKNVSDGPVFTDFSFFGIFIPNAVPSTWENGYAVLSRIWWIMPTFTGGNPDWEIYHWNIRLKPDANTANALVKAVMTYKASSDTTPKSFYHYNGVDYYDTTPSNIPDRPAYARLEGAGYTESTIFFYETYVYKNLTDAEINDLKNFVRYIQTNT